MPLVTAVALGLYRIGEKSFWIDETLSVLFARSPSATWDALWNLREINMLAYYLLLNVWLTLGDDEVVVRSLSVIFAAATIPVVYALAKRLIGGRSAPIAAFLLAVHPLFVQYSQEARAYSLLVFVSTLSTLLLLRAIERPTMPRWLLYGALTGLSLYIHLFGLVVVPAHALLALLHIRSIGRPSAVVAGFGSALMVALPGLVLFIVFSGEQIVWFPETDAEQIAAVLIALLGGGPAERPQARELALPIAYGTTLVLAAGVLGVESVRRSQRAHTLVALTAWLTLPVVATLGISLLYKPMFVDRYLLACLPALALLAAAAISRLPTLLGGVGLGVLVVFSASGLHSWYFEYEKEDWRSATAYLLAGASDGDALAFQQPWAYPPVYYYAERLDQFDALPTHIGPIVSQEAARDAASRHSTLWLVLSHNYGVGIDALDPALAQTLDAVASEFELTSRRTFARVEVLRYEVVDEAGAAACIDQHGRGIMSSLKPGASTIPTAQLSCS